MKPKPFRDLIVGNIFRDIDGTTYIKSGKSFTTGEEQKVLNCIILIPNKSKDGRGQLRFKDEDVYCEVLEEIEIIELKLEEIEPVRESNE